MAETLYKFFEADDVEIASGTPLVPGIEYKEYTIPDGEYWVINKLTGSSSEDKCEVELLYTDDGGTTWSNPFDATADKLMCLHLSNGNPVSVGFVSGFEFIGNGTDVRLRMVVKNYNTGLVSEIVCVLEGCSK